MTIRARFDHDAGIARSIDDDRQWWMLCAFPERDPRPDPFMFHHGCQKCAVALEAIIANGWWKGELDPAEALRRARGEVECPTS